MFSLIPFLAGAVVGVAVTWIAKDRQFKSRLEQGANAVAETARDAADKVKDIAGETKDAVEDVAKKSGL
jgi:hypothetical protein